MNSPRPFIALGIIIGIFVLISQCFFVVPETSRALILKLGEPADKVRGPGLGFKLPFIETVVYVEDRIQMFPIENANSYSADAKGFEVTSYVCWRITDPLLFYTSFRTQRVAVDRLHNIVFAQLQAVIGGSTLQEVVGGARTQIMTRVLKASNDLASKYGVTIVDVRIKRADLPNRPAIYERMKAERERMANAYRASGESNNLVIRAKAEYDRDVILAEGTRTSLIIRGEADAAAMKIFASAITAHPEFYDFFKSLETYKKGLQENTKIVLSSDHPLFRHLKSD